MTLKGSDLRDLTVEYMAASVKVLVIHISTVLCVIKNSDGLASPLSSLFLPGLVEYL